MHREQPRQVRAGGPARHAHARALSSARLSNHSRSLRPCCLGRAPRRIHASPPESSPPRLERCVPYLAVRRLVFALWLVLLGLAGCARRALHHGGASRSTMPGVAVRRRHGLHGQRWPTGPHTKHSASAFLPQYFLRSLFVAVEPRLSRCWFREPLKAAARRVGPAARLARTHLEEGVRARCARRGDAGGKARLPGGQLTGRTGRGHAVGGLGQRRGGCVPGRPAGCLRGGGHAARAIEDGDRARRVEWIARRRVVVRHGHDQAQVRAQAAQVAWGAPASAATLRRRTPRRVRGARDVSHAASCPTATSTLS